ncbi:MAG TPA: 16S rRNA (adenine(1518)-N(6)/adenine(1519)-N(6))-dimethyltransferase RsmA [Clostridia bacterium]
MSFDTKETMQKNGIRPTKSLGQNFLTDYGIVNRIADAACLSQEDFVVEVGPGIGSMTVELAKRAGKVVAIEIDKHLIETLSKNLEGLENVSIINKDILKLDVSKLINEEAEGYKKVKVISNLPYYITTPVIMKFLEENPGIDMMVFMMQKEVADRIGASPGGKDYGALTVAVQYYGRPEKLFNVPPHSFIPQPEVDSSVVRIEIHREPPVELQCKDTFFKTVKAAFGQRRKTLLNALSNSGYFIHTKDEIKEILKNTGIEEKRRGETLTIMQFAELSNAIFLKK